MTTNSTPTAELAATYAVLAFEAAQTGGRIMEAHYGTPRYTALAPRLQARFNRRADKARRYRAMAAR